MSTPKPPLRSSTGLAFLLYASILAIFAALRLPKTTRGRQTPTSVHNKRSTSQKAEPSNASSSSEQAAENGYQTVKKDINFWEYIAKIVFPLLLAAVVVLLLEEIIRYYITQKYPAPWGVGARASSGTIFGLIPCIAIATYFSSGHRARSIILRELPNDIKLTPYFIDAVYFFNRRSSDYLLRGSYTLILGIAFIFTVNFAFGSLIPDTVIAFYKYGLNTNMQNENTQRESDITNVQNISSNFSHDSNYIQFVSKPTKTTGNPIILHDFVGFTFLCAFIFTIRDLVVRLNFDDSDPSIFFVQGLKIIASVIISFLLYAIVVVINVTYTQQLPGIALILFVFILVGFFSIATLDWIVTMAARQIAGRDTLNVNALRNAIADFLPTGPQQSVTTLPFIDPSTVRAMEDLDFGTTQKLSNANPFIIWAKTKYQIAFIVDLIMQAQLRSYVSDQSYGALISRGITHSLRYWNLVLRYCIKVDKDGFSVSFPDANAPKNEVLEVISKSITPEEVTKHAMFFYSSSSFRRVFHLVCKLNGEEIEKDGFFYFDPEYLKWEFFIAVRGRPPHKGEDWRSPFEPGRYPHAVGGKRQAQS